MDAFSTKGVLLFYSFTLYNVKESDSHTEHFEEWNYDKKSFKNESLS